MENKERLYFGHPVNIYNTSLEDNLIRIIELKFPSCILENPNQDKHRQGYQRYKLERGDEHGMDYFFEMVLPQMDGGIFLPFNDGKFGTGVFKEAQFLHSHQKPIFLVTPEGAIDILDLRLVQPLSVEETRARIKQPYGA